jgi:hypothetical protein
MKKILTAIIAFLYITASTGATVHLHYCMGKQADWNLVKTESKTCNKCGMKKSALAEADNGCCKDEVKFIKDNSAQKITETGFNILQPINIAIPSHVDEIEYAYYSTASDKILFTHSPPLIKSVAVYILNCTYLI